MKRRTFLAAAGAAGLARSWETRSYTPRNLLNLKSSGVGIFALRMLPQTTGSTVRLMQIDLYIERLEVVS